MQFTYYQSSAIGSRRVNEDRIAHSYKRDALLLVVADGMGGHPDGECAADICVRLFVEQFRREAMPVIRNPFGFLRDSMARAHDAVRSYANQLSMPESPGTTCVACVVQAGVAHWVHCGDSRLYLFRQGKLLRETEDHSHLQRLINFGLVGSGDDASSARNLLFSCLGGPTKPTIDVGHAPLLHADVLLLSTDGFWSVVTKQEIADSLSTLPVREAAPGLVTIAEQRGRPLGDNVSAIFVGWGPEEAGRAEPPGATGTQIEMALQAGVSR